MHAAGKTPFKRERPGGEGTAGAAATSVMITMRPGSEATYYACRLPMDENCLTPVLQTMTNTKLCRVIHGGETNPAFLFVNRSRWHRAGLTCSLEGLAPGFDT